MFSPSRSHALHASYMYVASVLIVSMLAWVAGLPGTLLRAHAAPLSDISDTLSSSAPGASADHTILFTTPTGVVDDGSTLVVTFPSGFDLSTLTADDIDIADDGIDLTTAASCGAVEAAVSTSTNSITIEICSSGGGAIAGGSVVAIEVGQNATSSGTGVNRIGNPSTPDDYEITITTPDDVGATRVVIIEQVLVTGAVETYFLFEIDGVNANTTVNGDAVPTVATTTATSVAFGIVVPGTEYVLAQDLAVTTNAENGFVVTVIAGSDLTANTATIDSFIDGTATGTPNPWQEPSAQVGDADTYGHWGLTTEDITLSDGDSFGSALYVGDFLTNPREVMYATTSADGTTAHIGATRVGYKLEISVMQEASNEYQTTLTYVATPIF